MQSCRLDDNLKLTKLDEINLAKGNLSIIMDFCQEDDYLYTALNEADCFSADSNMVFVIMPFSDDNINKIYFAIIKPTVESINGSIQLSCCRADEIPGSGLIINKIKRKLQNARMVIAELTTFNQNVMYELGFSHSLCRDTILISQHHGRDLPSDIRHLRQIRYSMFCWDNVPEDDGENLRRLLINNFDLPWAENAKITKSRNNQIVHISKGLKSAEIMINANRQQATLRIRGGRTSLLNVTSAKNGKTYVWCATTLGGNNLSALLEKAIRSILKGQQERCSGA